MPTPPLLLPRHLVNQLLHLAQSSPDTEVCGLIGAAGGLPITCYPARTVAEEPGCPIALDAKEHQALLRRMREHGEDLFAIFHSHPDAPAEPSATDLQQATDPDALHLVVSLNTKGVLELRGFRIGQDRRAEEIPLLLEPAQPGIMPAPSQPPQP